MSYIEPNYLIKIDPTQSKIVFSADSEKPTDEYFSRQWGLNNQGSDEEDPTSPIAGVDINMLRAWPK